MRRLLSFFCVLASLALLAVLFIGSVQLVAMDRDFYALEYQKMDTARRLGVTNSALETATEDLLQYIDGEEIDLSETTVRVGGERQRVFRGDDAEHMVDVRNLYSGARTLRNISLLFVLFILLITLFAAKRDRAGLYARSYLTGFAVVGVILLVLGLWIQIDFNMFWNAFHHLFFRNLLWMMDPATSFMINMFPGQFWYDMCMRILLYFSVGAGALLIASLSVLLVKKHRRNTLMFLQEDDEGDSRNTEVDGAIPSPEKGTAGRAPWQNQ